MSKVVEITKALADLDEERTLQLVGEALWRASSRRRYLASLPGRHEPGRGRASSVRIILFLT